MTARYREEKRRAFDLWAARLLSIVEPVTPSNVIQIAARHSDDLLFQIHN